MRCPKCDLDDYIPSTPCRDCGFSGDPAAIEWLAHVDWLIGQIPKWAEMGIQDRVRKRIWDGYSQRRQVLRSDLKLEQPALSAAQVQQAWKERIRLELLLDRIQGWLEAGALKPEETQEYTGSIRQEIVALRIRLKGRARPLYPSNDPERVEIVRHALYTLQTLKEAALFSSAESEARLWSQLKAEVADLQRGLGISPAPQIEAATPIDAVETIPAPPIQAPEVPSAPSVSATPTVPATPPPPPAAPRLPWRERLWRSLLSERTLQAMLFLGIFLLFTAAISFVVWGWKDFPRPVRVTIPFGFTAIFFGIGWLVRARTSLYRSGIALSAIAALLVPIDFYTIYANYGNPPEGFHQFWLLTSLVCLGVYLLAALIIQNITFGYLVGVAAGSCVLSVLEVLNQTYGNWRDWFSAGITGLAVALILLAAGISRMRRAGRWQVLVAPFRALGLLSAGVILPLSLGVRLVARPGYNVFHTATTLDWGLGSAIFAWGASHHRSRSLGILAALALPVAVYLAQAALFHHLGINPAWQAFGLALLVPLYLYASYRLSAHPNDPVLSAHGRTALTFGSLLGFASALWSLMDLSSGAAAASSHLVLCASMVLAAALWNRPAWLYLASFFSFSAASFAMSALELPLSNSSISWASLSLVHILAAIRLGQGRSAQAVRMAAPLVIGGYILAGIALIPALLPYDGNLFVYTLGNWLGLSAWGGLQAHRRSPGFVLEQAQPGEKEKKPRARRLPWLKPLLSNGAIFHWFVALPLPVWVWTLFTNLRPADASLALALTALAWGMFAVGIRLGHVHGDFQQPWNSSALLVSIASIVAAFAVDGSGFTPAIVLIAAGCLYFADAGVYLQSGQLAFGALTGALGYLLLLYRFKLEVDVLQLGLAGLVAGYILAGLGVEGRRSTRYPARFLAPLYFSAHLLGGVVIIWIYTSLFLEALSGAGETSMDLLLYWGAASQLLLALAYGLFAWGRYREFWAHIAAWLGVAGGGFIFISLSRGQGSSAASGALMAAVFVLAERALYRLRTEARLRRRLRGYARLAWTLFRRPFLVAGWCVSGGAIGLAVFRNLLWLGGGRTQQIWACAGLVIVTALYAGSARLFRQARFAWLAAGLSWLPWTILTNLGWFTPYRLTESGFAVSWLVLAWVLLAIGLYLPPAYAVPAKTVTHLIVPFSLLWALPDPDASRYTFALAIAFYTLGAWRDYQAARQAQLGLIAQAITQARRLNATKNLFPALGLAPIWCLYWLAWTFPAAGAEHYGLVLLAFGSLGMLAADVLKRRSPRPELAGAYSLPGYLTAYTALFFGSLLVSGSPALQSMALLYDAALMLVSARLFRRGIWVYLAAGLVVPALLLALSEAGICVERWGWWLNGLAAMYLPIAWQMRRSGLSNYSGGALHIGLLVVAFGLPNSSIDQTGAVWGYAGAALIYAVVAFWLGQPALLSLASLLVVVPYAIAINRSLLRPEAHGLALFPGALLALWLGIRLDAIYGRWDGFPWKAPLQWPEAFIQRARGWWGLPLYTLGFGLGAAAPFFTAERWDLAALNYALLVPLFGWAIYHFRLRLWLFAAVLAAHLAAGALLEAGGWWYYPDHAWLRFLPVTSVTLLLAIAVQRRLGESPPLAPGKILFGWSGVLYLFAFADIFIAQLSSLYMSGAGALVSLAHALMLALLASTWPAGWWLYGSCLLGAISLAQWAGARVLPPQVSMVELARLALGYGAVGYGLTLIRRRAASSAWPGWLLGWERPLQLSALGLTLVVLLYTPVLGINLVAWTVRALLGLPFRQIVDMETVQMAVGVFGALGLLFIAASAVYRRLRLGYLAIGMLLFSWCTYAFYAQAWDGLRRVQWYALPAGLYLLGIAYLEWQRGNRGLARGMDYAAMLLMMGSLFWQTLVFGWAFALILGGEGFAGFWWGSARRLRRFFYAGMSGVILATMGQLINALQAVNQWITFGLIGLALVGIAVLVERKLETVKAWQEVLESWE